MDEETLLVDLGLTSLNSTCTIESSIISDGEIYSSEFTPSDIKINIGISNNTDNSLTITNSPIQNTGTINIEHKNAITAQSTLGIYPFTVDRSGHIASYGDVLGVVTTQKDGLISAFSDVNKIEQAISQNDYLYNSGNNKYQKLPATAFVDTQYTDGTAGYVLKANQDGNGNNIIETYAPLISASLTGEPTAPTANSSDNSTKIATTAFVKTAVSEVSGAMHYKGTVGVGGTVSDLPISGVNSGDTYKVITEGTYAGQLAKIGDMFIALNSNPEWTYIPSGDDSSVKSITAGAGLTGGTITSTGTIALDVSGVTAGTYQGLQIDSYGRVVSATDMGYGNFINTNLATNSNTYYLTGVTTIGATSSTIYNTRISNNFTGVKYVSNTTTGGKMYVDDKEVVLGLYYTIS